IGVQCEPLEQGPLHPQAVTGFLFGMGDPTIDYRATALVQQVPAEGGGYLASVDAQGVLSIRDFSQSKGKAGYWALNGNVNFSNLPLIASSTQIIPKDAWPLRIEIAWIHDESKTLRIRAIHQETEVARAETRALTFDDAAGGVSLFSAHGPMGSKLGFGFSEFRMRGGTTYEDRAFGPVMGVLYTAFSDAPNQKTLRVTVQLPVTGDAQRPQATLVLGKEEKIHIPGTHSSDGSYTVRFQKSDWSGATTIPYEILLDGEISKTGVIRREPAPNEPIVLGLASCVKNQYGPIHWNKNGLWFPHADLTERFAAQDPDILTFVGDQIYEGDLTGPDNRSPQIQLYDYHTKWQRWLWAFGDLAKDRPTVTLPDDHDVFHGNLWGSGGIKAKPLKGMSAQDSGGYKMDAAFVNAVHGTQVSHLPPSKITPVVGQGITTWSTTFRWGQLDFCVLSDRMFKSSPSAVVHEGGFKNGWSQAEGYDPVEADVPDAVLLGVEQEALLKEWAKQPKPDDGWMKILLSGSPFACLHTLPASAKSDAVVTGLKVPEPGAYPPDDRPVADGDSNGWPQTPRNRAVRALQDAGALHLAGDQHLATLSWYAIDKHRDGTVAFTGPALANTFPRRWMPQSGGANRKKGEPYYTGDFLDGFGNKITMLAAANPVAAGIEPSRLMNVVPGYGIVRFDPRTKSVDLEAWPRWADPKDRSQMFPGWPYSLNQDARPFEMETRAQLKEAFQSAVRTSKPVLVRVESSHCHDCVNLNQILLDEEVAAFLNEGFFSCVIETRRRDLNMELIRELGLPLQDSGTPLWAVYDAHGALRKVLRAQDLINAQGMPQKHVVLDFLKETEVQVK
ncbi:MAG: alkaline phosphatase D family protein, partial [Planctomycetes bacterium]|nr:alkaline phosphatase D family protein [Planctomycetota bacterium]